MATSKSTGKAGKTASKGAASKGAGSKSGKSHELPKGSEKGSDDLSSHDLPAQNSNTSLQTDLNNDTNTGDEGAEGSGELKEQPKAKKVQSTLSANSDVTAKNKQGQTKTFTARNWELMGTGDTRSGWTLDVPEPDEVKRLKNK